MRFGQVTNRSIIFGPTTSTYLDRQPRALGSIPVKKGKAVYFALEDNERRLQARCASLMDDRSIEEGQLLFSTTIDKFYKKEDKKPEENGLAQLENLIDEMGEELRVIFIDTLALVTPKGKNENS